MLGTPDYMSTLGFDYLGSMDDENLDSLASWWESHQDQVWVIDTNHTGSTMPVVSAQLNPGYMAAADYEAVNNFNLNGAPTLVEALQLVGLEGPGTELGL